MRTYTIVLREATHNPERLGNLKRSRSSMKSANSIILDVTTSTLSRSTSIFSSEVPPLLLLRRLLLVLPHLLVRQSVRRVLMQQLDGAYGQC